MDIPGARPAQEVDTNGLYHLCPFGGPVGESVDRPVVVRTFQTVLTTCHPKKTRKAFVTPFSRHQTSPGRTPFSGAWPAEAPSIGVTGVRVAPHGLSGGIWPRPAILLQTRTLQQRELLEKLPVV